MFVGVGLRALLVSELYCAISKKRTAILLDLNYLPL